MKQSVLLAAAGLLLTPGLIYAERSKLETPETVPGVVITHIPAKTETYIGSAGIVRLSDGTYLAKHDEFGPKSSEDSAAVTRVFRSQDRGQSWHEIAKVDGLYWCNIFEHRGAAYMIGTHHRYGPLVVCKSTDGGVTWSTPNDKNSGLIRPGKFHTAPMPVVTHNGRLWRAIEDGDGPQGWGNMFRPRVMSIPVDGNLLAADEWTITNPIERDGNWLGGDFACVLEGNAVVDRDGIVHDILRSDHERTAAVTTVSADGKTQSIDPKFDRISLPGSSKKMLIRWDEPSHLYWALTNPTPTGTPDKKATKIRNTLAIFTSPDLHKWTQRTVLLQHPEPEFHAFQYPDWIVEGNDMLVVSRTAFDDGEGGAHRAHDANYLTFHRVPNFRKLATSGGKESD